jgi:GrpB-like predicted nucleotidyltransferase (UPF0157 family)
MQVFRFDRDIAMKLREGGRAAQLGQILGPSAIDHAGVLYLDAGEHYCARSAGSSQIIAVISGSGVASVAERAPFSFGDSQALVFDASEPWRVDASEPVIALCAEGTFELWAVAVTKDLEVVAYDDSWPGDFATIQGALNSLVSGLAVRIDHVGSTAVPGLDAKPIIDVDVVVERVDDIAAATQQLSEAGYRWRGDLGVAGREAFDTPSDSTLPTHHLYLVVDHNEAHLNHVLLRDALREDPSLREEYGQLKRRNVELAQGNMDIYLAAKAGFVAAVLASAREERGLSPAEYWTPEI